MMKLNRILALGLVVAAFLVGASSVPWAGDKGDVNMTWEGETLSADLVGVPLQGVLEDLSKARGIWFKVHASVADQKITVHFTGLSLEEGLKRILVRMDYSLEFDRNGKPTGVVIMGEKTAARGAGGSLSTPYSGPEAAPEIEPEPAPEIEPQESDAPTEMESESVQSPFGPVPPTREEMEQFRAIRNSPPPGGSPEVTGEELEQFEIMRNTDAPGGPPTVTPEELEHFKMRRNAPPPGE
jgi:hypothetical protein